MWEILLYGLVVGSVTGAIIYLTSCCEDYDIYDRKNRLNWNKITRYKNCDVLHHYNNVKMCGYSKKFSEEEMIGLAVLNACRVITRIGENGRWYLKGRDIAIDTIKQEIKENTGKYENGTYVLLLEE